MRRTSVTRCLTALVAVSLALGGCGLVAGDDERSNACVDGLIQHLPRDVALVDGADLTAARAAGYDDATSESAARSQLEYGVRPDPVTRLTLGRDAGDEPDGVPYDPPDVHCWVGHPGGGWIARGDFDPERVELFDDAELHASEDGSLVTDDDELLDDGDPPARLLTLMESFDPVVASFTAVRPRDQEQWTGVALVHGDDMWELDVRWVRWNEQEAEAVEEVVVDVLGHESELGALIVEDAADVLERDGAILSVDGELAGAPASWLRLVQIFDAIFDVDLTEE